MPGTGYPPAGMNHPLGFAENSFLAGGDVTWQAQSLARKRAKGTTMADTSDIRQRLTDEVRMLLPELLEASTNYRAAKARYRRRREVFAGSVNQDIEVSQDRLAKKAIADCNWYGSETERLSTTLMALLHALDRGRHGAADHYGRIVP